jgi:hypothetical protein
VRRKSKSPIAKVQRDLWELCKAITRLRYPNVCYTCGKTGLEGSNWHTGHMWPKAALSAYLKYDLRILRPQCYHCNINLGGNGAVFYANMVRDHGPKFMAQLERDRNVTVKAIDHYLGLVPIYAQRLLELSRG